MEDMQYITQSSISLDDLAVCLKNAGYTVFGQEFGSVEALVVYYPMQYQEENVETYCRWTKINLQSMEVAQIRRFYQKDTNLKFLFNIMYGGSSQFLPLIPVFKRVLECYGGCAYLEGQFFDTKNIEDMQYIKYGVFSEDEETDI